MSKILYACLCAGIGVSPGMAADWVNLLPAGAQVRVGIAKTSTNLIRLEWGANINRGYVMERKLEAITNEVWKTHSVMLADQSPMRRSVPSARNIEVFRVMEVQSFGVGQQVDWGIMLPIEATNSRNSLQATWTFDDRQVRVVTGNEWDMTIPRVYLTTGLKTVHVRIQQVSPPDSWEVHRDWAVMITNGADGNLVLNGDFEQQSGSLPLGWTKGGFGDNARVLPYPVEGRNGSRAAEVTVSNHVRGDAKWVSANIPVTPGATYRFTDWYKASVSNNITFLYTLTNGTTRFNGKALPPPSEDWREVSFDFVVPWDVTALAVMHALTANGTLVIDDVSIEKTSDPLPSGMVSFHFDDGHEFTSLSTAADLEERGMRGVYYVVNGYLDHPGFLSVGQALALQLRHGIGGHTDTHSDLTLQNQSSVEMELAGARDELISWGFSPVESLVYPFGAHNTNVHRLAAEAGYRWGVTTESGWNNKANFNRFALKRMTVYATTTVEQVKGWIDTARVNREWLILGFHRVGEGLTNADGTPNVFAYDRDDFREILDYVALTGVRVVTTEEGARELSGE